MALRFIYSSINSRIPKTIIYASPRYSFSLHKINNTTATKNKTTPLQLTLHYTENMQSSWIKEIC
jgi:hypothetical protein